MGVWSEDAGSCTWDSSLSDLPSVPEVAMEDKDEVKTHDSNGPFGLITPKLLTDLFALCVGPNLVFRGVPGRIERLLGTDLYRNAPTNLQIRTELDIHDLLHEMEMSIYWTSGFNSEDTVNRSGSIPIEISGVVDLPRQVQYASGIHERLTAIYRSLSPNHSEADSGNWCEEFQTDRREQVNYYESAFDAGQSEMHLTDTTAATILSQIDFWLRRPSEITEEVKLMENIKATMSRTLKATNDVEISVKPNQPSKSPWKIEHSEIDVKFNDGGGVYRGEWQVAPVDIRKVNSSDEQSVEHEAKIWAGLNHPHVAPLLGVVATEDGMLFITEPAEHGNLIKYRENHRNEIWQKLYEVGLALEYLHERGIIHGGLKPDNIRIGHDGRAKLTGFECSTTLSNLEQRNIALRGDSRWLAPELLSNSELSFASDVYSFAMCIIAVVSDAPPFGVDMSDADIGEKVKTGSLVPKCPNEFNEDQWNLVEKMYCFDANARTTLHEVVQQLKKFATEEKVAAAENIRNDPVVHLVHDRGQWADAPMTVKGDDVCHDVKGSLTTITRTNPSDPSDPLIIPLRELFIHECESRGGTTHVSRHVGSWLNSKVTIEFLSNNTKESATNFKRVAGVWFALKHPNVLQLYGINETGKRNLFICEYPTYGNLSKYLDGGETSIWQSILDIALGLRFLHSRGIVHGDLKCHNFLVDRGGKAKLAGLEHYISVSEDTMQQEGKEEEKDISRSRTCSRWRAPECRGSDAGKDSFQSDVYSFGKCIIEALTGELPEGKHKPDFVTTGCLPNVPPSRCGQRQWCLIQEMCAENPAERPSMPAVVQQIARFIAVERAVRDTKSKKEEFRRVLQNNPCLETHLHAMVLDRMPKEETNYAKDRNERQQTLRDLVIIALDIIYQLSTCHDFKKQLETYTFKTCKTAENTTCRQNIHDGNIDLWHINGADVLRSGDALGRGAFARVYRGEWIGTQVAIKRWIKNDEDAIASFNKEVDVWYPLNHPHIINLYGACRIPTQDLKPMCVCDLAENGKVTTYLSKSEHKHEVWQILYEAALGLQGVHARGVVHSDLKCDNILVTTNGKAKISDFGLSFRNKSTSAEKENELRVSNETKPTTISKAGGALQWKAPEFLRGEPATQLSDIYSFGMCVIEAVTGNAPWNCKHDTTVKDCVTKGKLPTRSASFKEDVQWHLVEALCHHDPTKRLPLDDAVRVLQVLARRSNQAVRA